MKWIRLSIFLCVGGILWIASKIDWQFLSSNSQDTCAFCNHEVLNQNTFYKSQSCLALLTHKPAFDGHVLVIPKRHVERFEDLTDIEMVEIKKLIQKINAASQKIYGSTGYLLLEKNGQEAGQSVPHVHFHYMPTDLQQNRFISVLQIFIAPLLKPLSSEEIEERVALYSDL